LDRRRQLPKFKNHRPREEKLISIHEGAEKLSTQIGHSGHGHGCAIVHVDFRHTVEECERVTFSIDERRSGIGGDDDAIGADDRMDGLMH
jgi:hypothetical protein